VSLRKGDGDLSFEMSVVHPAPRTAVFTCSHKSDPKDNIFCAANPDLL